MGIHMELIGQFAYRSAFEKEVMGRLEKIAEFQNALLFQGDQRWIGITQGIKTPDLICIKEYGEGFSVQAYDIKENVNGIKPAQVSPLTLKSLYGINHFRTTLREIVGEDSPLLFMEGKFITPHDQEMTTQTHKVSKAYAQGKLRKIRRMQMSIGYYPVDVFVTKGGRTTPISQVQNYSLDGPGYSVQSTLTGKIEYHFGAQEKAIKLVTGLVLPL